MSAGPRPAVALCVVALVVVSGCGAVPTFDGDSTGPPSGDEVAASFEALDGLSATEVQTVETNGTVNRTRSKLRLVVGDEPGEVRRLQRVVAPDEEAGDVVARREAEVVVYDASDREATRYPVPLVPGQFADRGEFYARVAEAAREGEMVAADGVSPLPVVPAASGAPSVGESVEGYEVEYLGTETVSGRIAHGFRLSAVTDAALTMTRTLWLDAEHYYPLQSARTATFDNETYHIQSVLRNVTFDADLDANAVSWSPPANASVQALGVGEHAHNSRPALAADAPLSVPRPEVPDGYAFDRGRVLSDDNYTQVVVEFAAESGAEVLAVSKYAPGNESTAGAWTAGESVTVAGRNATFLRTEYASAVNWRCGDLRYTVLATDLDRDAVLAVAESVACE